jgi:chromosome partitioning protein
MSARIISVCNQKGGCGKTTITMALAAAFANRRYRVLVVDGDPQGSASTWSANANEVPFPATVANLSRAGKALPAEVRKMVNDYDIVLIDCPPSVDSPVPQAALLITDLALIPLIPSPTDMAAAIPFLQLVENAKNINEALQARVVANMVQKNTKVATGYLELFDALPVPTLKTQLALRTGHRQACAFGSSVHGIGDREAMREVDALLGEVLALLELPGRLPSREAGRTA